MSKKKKGRRADGLVEIKRKMPDGSFKHFYGTSKAECELKYRNAWAETTQEQAEAADGPLFAQVADEWLNKKSADIQESTFAGYTSVVKSLKSAFAGLRITEISDEQVNALLDGMKQSKSATKTMATARSVLSMIFSYCALPYGIKDNPAARAKTPRGMRTKRKPPSKDAVQKILQQIDEEVTAGDVSDGAMAAAIYLYTGVRRGECLALKYSDIDFDGKTLHVSRSISRCAGRNASFEKETKTENGERTLPLFPQLETVILARPALNPSDYIVKASAEPMTNREYECRWEKFCRSCGLSEYETKVRYTQRRGRTDTIQVKKWKATVTAHPLRHYYATLLYKAQVPMEVAVRMMGHADSEMIRRVYLDIDGELLQDAAEKIQSYMKAKVVKKS